MMFSQEQQFQVGITEIRSLIDAVKNKYGFDFSHYAVSSFQRRVVRTMNVFKVDSVNALIKKVLASEETYNLFLKEITVNTTEMFRDPSFWRVMRDKVIANFLTSDSIRIWHAGCSSGEEVYSMAILLQEAGLLSKAKIFATDINEDVISVAKKGEFHIRNMDMNRENYKRYDGKKTLEDYYTTKNDIIKMDPNLIKGVHFNVHNLVSGEPFSRFDIILCRNVMIYFDKVLQDQVTQVFYDSLFNKGYLAIGAKESLIWCKISSKMDVIDEKDKIFQKAK